MNENEKVDRRVGVNFCVIKMVDGEPLVLLQKRDQNSKDYKGSWVIPGGAHEQGEELSETASRELSEEYNLIVSNNKWHKIADRPDDNPGAIFATFIKNDLDFEMHEGEAYQWHPINKLHKLELGYKHNEFIVEALQEFIMTHSEYDEPKRELRSLKVL